MHHKWLPVPSKSGEGGLSLCCCCLHTCYNPSHSPWPLPHSPVYLRHYFPPWRNPHCLSTCPSCHPCHRSPLIGPPPALLHPRKEPLLSLSLSKLPSLSPSTFTAWDSQEICAGDATFAVLNILERNNMNGERNCMLLNVKLTSGNPEQQLNFTLSYQIVYKSSIY